MRIREYRNQDWPRLCEIHDAARRDELRASGLMEAFLSLEQAAATEGLFDAQVVVAEVDGRVLGFAAYSARELTWLYCDPSAYRRGTGRALLRHVIDASEDELYTEVLAGNAAALALYLSEGFNVLRKVEGQLAGNEAYAATAYYLRRDRAR
ncbi:MAG: GNAT family N-acetyltransferase [Lysobacter sp.]|nr:GNAT family N-acetyltransferase [Lysobacter sp.]